MSNAANATETKFGDPVTRIARTDRWTVLFRPKQVTLGSLVVVCREPVTAFADVSAEAFAELRGIVGRVETVLRETVAFERINWLMLMMVDPDVHFHVIPRHAGSRDHSGVTLADAGWPGPPALDSAVALDASAQAGLIEALRAAWSRRPD